jgi:hypothetical protein
MTDEIGHQKAMTAANLALDRERMDFLAQNVQLAGELLTTGSCDHIDLSTVLATASMMGPSTASEASAVGTLLPGANVLATGGEIMPSPGDKLTPQELIMSNFVPGDLLQRKVLSRKWLTPMQLKTLRGTPKFLRVEEVFPACTLPLDEVNKLVLNFEKSAAEMSGGTFTAEPGEGAVPDADKTLHWERGYLEGEAPHEHVPLLMAQLPDGKAKPVAILLHGTGSCKEKMIPYLETYAKQGFFAVSMDNRHLGERAMVPEINPALALVSKGGSINAGTTYLARRLAVWARLSRPARLASYQASMRRAALGESQEHPFVFDSAWDVVRIVDYLATRVMCAATMPFQWWDSWGFRLVA